MKFKKIFLFKNTTKTLESKKNFFIEQNVEAFFLVSNFFKFYLNGLNKKGKKLFFFNRLAKTFFDVYFFITRINLKTINVSLSKTEISTFFEKNNINIFLNWLIEDYKYFYFLYLWKPKKAKTKRKKKKQKKQKQFNALKFLLKKSSRWKIFFKIFFLKLSNISAINLQTKILKFFLDLILNQKKSWLYLFKIEFYKKLLFN